MLECPWAKDEHEIGARILVLQRSRNPDILTRLMHSEVVHYLAGSAKECDMSERTTWKKIKGSFTTVMLFPILWLILTGIKSVANKV